MRTAIHLALHLAVPLAVAWVCFRDRWWQAAAIMIATMIIDADHLLAAPIFDPHRCSIGFHPLHTLPAIALYALATVPRTTRVAGIGLLIHVALDFTDCMAM